MREEGKEEIEVHVAGICFDNDKVLALKRSPYRELYPNLWECGGGQVNRGESFDEAVKRQLKEEAGIILGYMKPFGTYEIKIDSEQKIIPGLYYACQIQGYFNRKCPQISEEHTEWKLQPFFKIDKLEFIPGLKENIKKAYSVFKADV